MRDGFDTQRALGDWFARRKTARVIEPQPQEYEVAVVSGHPYRLTNRRARKITCVAGCAWITVHRSSQDLILSSGQVTNVEGERDVLITGMKSCVVKIS
jgi:hypothetical protein